MKHEQLNPIIEAICYGYDYGTDSRIKSQELIERLHPLGSRCNDKTVSEALYGIIAVSLELLKEIDRCTDVINVEEKTLSLKED